MRLRIRRLSTGIRWNIAMFSGNRLLHFVCDDTIILSPDRYDQNTIHGGSSSQWFIMKELMQ